MVRLHVDVNKFNSEMQAKINRLNTQVKRTTARSARYLMYTAKLLAPKKTGKLVNSIRMNKIQNGHTVKVTAGMHSFPYPKWVNQDIKSITFKKGAWVQNLTGGTYKWTMIAPPGTVAVYGKSPSNWKWTGTPGFFTKAIKKTQKKLEPELIQAYNKAMGVRIR